MSILIIGANGSMGKRYQAIMRYLGRPYHGVDKETSEERILELAAQYQGTIVATPTDTHAEWLEKLIPLKNPILCEKPVTKDIPALHRIRDMLKEHGTPFRMMFQYSMLAKSDSIGLTRYDYFRHGNDGLIWDCLQVIGLARSKINLGEVSPVWSCMINGRTAHLSHMDAAYIAYVQKWFQKPRQDFQRILEIHEKTADYAGNRKEIAAHG